MSQDARWSYGDDSEVTFKSGQARGNGIPPSSRAATLGAPSTVRVTRSERGRTWMLESPAWAQRLFPGARTAPLPPIGSGAKPGVASRSGGREVRGELDGTTPRTSGTAMAAKAPGAGWGTERARG